MIEAILSTNVGICVLKILKIPFTMDDNMLIHSFVMKIQKRAGIMSFQRPMEIRNCAMISGSALLKLK